MAKRPFKFYVEMEGNSYSPVGEIKQLDTMELDITVTENGVPKDLSGSEISLYVRKKDRTILEQKENINIVTASEGTIKIKVKNQATTCVGMTLFELELKGSDGVATSGTFIFNVTERVVNGEIVISKDEVHALVEIEKYVAVAKVELENFKRLQNKMLETNETINGNESERVLAESGRVQEEENRVEAENKRVEQFKTFENRIVKNEKEIADARTATTGEEFNSLDERIDCEVERLNEKIEFSFLQQEEKERHVIKNTVEGMTNDMIIKGITLKNIFPHIRSNLVTNAIVEDGLFTINPINGSYSNIWDVNNPFYRPNTEYTIIIDIIENTLVANEGRNAIMIGADPTESVFGENGYSKEIANGFIGKIVTKLRTISDFSLLKGNYGARIFLSNNFNGGSLKLKINIFEGDLRNKEIDCFNGIKSSGQQEGNKIRALSHGKNFIDYNMFKASNETKIKVNSDGIILEGNRAYANMWISLNDLSLVEGVTYYAKLDKEHISGSDESYYEIWINEKKTGKKDFIYRRGDKVKLYVFANGSNFPSQNLIKNVIISEENGDNYEPYQSDKKDILLSQYGFDEGLRGLSSITYDELNYVKNIATKRIEKYIFSGMEEISKWADSEDACWFTITNNSLKLNYQSSNDNLMCNNFIEYAHGYFSSQAALNQGLEGITANGNYFTIRIKKSKLSTQDVEGFKAWLRNNPTTVYYELSEPIETHLNENINLKTFNEKTYIVFRNSLIGTSSFKVPVNTISALSTLTDDIEKKTDKKEVFKINKKATESLELSEYNHDDINNNIFPYIMDLELMVLDMMELNGYTNKKYKIMERAGLYMTSKQALERLIRQKKVTLEDALERIVRYNDAGRITDAEAIELTDLANEIL